MGLLCTVLSYKFPGNENGWQKGIQRGRSFVKLEALLRSVSVSLLLFSLYVIFEKLHDHAKILAD